METDRRHIYKELPLNSPQWRYSLLTSVLEHLHAAPTANTNWKHL